VVTLVLRGGRIFDGSGQPAQPGTLVIVGNKILEILPAASIKWPADAKVLDVTGKTLMPGLIDLHTHLANAADVAASPGAPPISPFDVGSDSDGTLRGVEKLRYYIESGITSVRDTGSRGEVPFRLKAWVRDHRLPGPRVFPAGQLITATGGHASEALTREHLTDGEAIEVSGPDGWREAVRQQFKHGADFIKITSHFSRQEVAAAIDEAHALGLKVTCDCETFYIQWAVDAGIDCIEHPLPRTDDTIRAMVQKGVADVPTQIPYQIIFNLEGGYFRSTSRRFGFSKEDNLEMVRRLRQAGVKMGVGTDLVVDWFRYLPNPYIAELKNFVAAGDTIPEALVRATRTSSEILDMDDKLGTLEAGKLADVIVVAGRPDQDLDDLAHVEVVIRDGEMVVSGGHVVVPPHIPRPLPAPHTPGARP
jgi:imidazolonepropionase-like amidohydrolase